MKLTEAMIAWTPGTDHIRVGPHPDCTGWSDHYDLTTGACEAAWHKMTPERRLAELFITFNTIVVCDSVPPAAAHQAFLAIDEYRCALPADQPGATRTQGEAA